jgi:hypothetical protein
MIHLEEKIALLFTTSVISFLFYFALKNLGVSSAAASGRG